LRLPSSLERDFLTDECCGAVSDHYEACQGATMDNWGDPWADNADSTKPPTKSEVTSPLPPAFAPVPPLLNGILDDAGWGNDDDDFGDWSTAPAKEGAAPAHAEPAVDDAYTTHDPPRAAGHERWGSEAGPNEHAVHDAGDWAALDMDASKDHEQVLSDSSDSSTTVQANENAEAEPAQVPVQLQPDDDSSARASTSPSETSHNDVPTESPRTSYEDEGVDKSNPAGGLHEDTIASTEESEIELDTVVSDAVSSGDDVILEHSEDTSGKEETDLGDPTEDDAASNTAEVTPSSNDVAVDVSTQVRTARSSTTSGGRPFVVDSVLVDQLFSASKKSTELGDAPDDPIYSMSARKAWYRLTRKQTMREYNNGNDDDNYVRVNWANSNVRTEVNKIVGRWAREDRISGTGPGARASFYWDTQAPTQSELTAMHARQRSSVSIATASAPKEGNFVPLSTDRPAAFNWSSPSTSTNPWHHDTPDIRSTSSPVAPKQPALTKVQRQEERAVSVDLTARQPNPARTSVANVETPVAPSLISPPFKNTPTAPNSPDPYSDLGALDLIPAPKSDPVSVSVDDDDDWGEMVSSPTVSTPTAMESPSLPTSRNNTFSTSATTPQSTKSTAIRDQSPETMHAAPIVRLKSAISPTSALFKANSFVPLRVEQGPIGPGILKPVNRSASVTNKKTVEQLQPAIESEPVVIVASKEPGKAETVTDVPVWSNPSFHAPEVARSRSETPPTWANSPTVASDRPLTPPAPIAAAAQSNVDPWADADFSFFESALPAAPPPPKNEPADPFTAFESPGRPASVSSSTRPFNRSPPRQITPPPAQPLTGATNMAQRRKAEEDQIIEEILSGLPDLSYMLQ
tara:strand:- start:8137 stop:10713 length:2577 start_codon:yes stop_codon:yes gene_type:complete